MDQSAAVFLIHRTLPGKRDEVQTTWAQYLQPAIEANEDHIFYFYCFDSADPDVIRVYQQYRSREAAMAFLATEAYGMYEHAVAPLLTGPPEVHLATPQWIKVSDDYSN